MKKITVVSSGTKRRLILAMGSLFVLCFLCACLAALLPGGDNDDSDTASRAATPAILEVTRVVEVTATTDAPAVDTSTFTDTPLPATEIVPTDTPVPAVFTDTPTPPIDALVGFQLAIVDEVIDGDTITVLLDGVPYNVRYIGIDAPETNDASGRIATEANVALVNGQRVYLEADQTDTDQYDRLLRYVYLPDGRMVNEELVRAGHALSVAYPPDTTHQVDFDAAQAAAQQDIAGLWQETSWALRTANIRSGPGTTYDVVDGARPGDLLDITARTADGAWLKLGTGGWISSSLVGNPPSDVAVVQAPTATPAPVRSQQIVPAPAPQAVCSCSGADYDCNDFGSWAAAQDCFVYCLQTVGYDVHRLDRDNDGVVCESMR